MTVTLDAPPKTTPNIIQLIASVMADVTHVGKDGWNPGQKFHFRGIDAVVNAVGPALRKAGVVPTPILESATYRDILTGSNRTSMQQCTVQVRYQFWGPAGDHLDVVVPGEAFDSGDKGTAKAMSVAYRIALLQLLALPTDEPDPDVTSYERAPHTATDTTWLTGVQQRIDTAIDHAVLERIGAEIGTQADAGKLTTDDGTALRARFDARWAHLRTEASAKADPPDRPLERPTGQAPADEWTRPEPGAQQTLPPPVVGVPRASNPQLTKIRILMLQKRGLGKDRRVVLDAVSKMVRRPLESSKELSSAEASTLIETLNDEPDFANEQQLPPSTPVDPAQLADETRADLFNTLAGSIRAANTHDDLVNAGRSIDAEVANGRITLEQRGALVEVWNVRQQYVNELDAALAVENGLVSA